MKGHAQVVSKTKIKNFGLRNVERVVVDGLPSEFFNVVSDANYNFYIEVLINKLCNYSGNIIFYNENEAEVYPLTIEIK